MAGDGILPITLAVTLLGALATYAAPSRYCRTVALVASAPALAITSLMFYRVGFGDAGAYQFVTDWPWIEAIGARLYFGVDGLSAPLAWLTAVLTPILILYSWGQTERARLFFTLILVLDATVIGVFTALDLLLFYVFWEFVLIPMYFLIALWGGPDRRYASYKFILYTGGASLIMLLGFMALYFGIGATGETPTHAFGIPELTEVSGRLGVAHGFAMLTFAALGIGFLVKMPSFPFHTWLPDAHVQAPTAGSVILAGVLLKMGSYGLMRIAFPILPDAALDYQWVLFALGSISVLYGAFLCLAQDDLKSLIAYSSISHMGLITIGLATFHPLGWAGAAYMNIAHGVISAGMFMAAGSLQHSTGTRLISRLGGLAQRTPALGALTLALFLASLGLPGMMGFIAEFNLFASMWAAFGWWIMLPVWSILVTAGYFLWAYQRVYHGPERFHAEIDVEHIHEPPAHERYTIAALVLMAIVFGVLPALLLGPMNEWTMAVLSAMGVS